MSLSVMVSHETLHHTYLAGNSHQAIAPNSNDEIAPIAAVAADDAFGRYRRCNSAFDLLVLATELTQSQPPQQTHMADYDTAVNDESPTPPLRPITSCASLATDVSDTPEPTKLPPAHLRFSLPKNDSSKSGASSSNSLHFVPSLSAHFARSNSGHENNIDKTSQQQQRHYINCNSNSPPERMRLAKRKLSLDEPSLKPLKRRDVSATPSAASSSSSSSSSSRSSSPVLSRPESPIAPLSQPSHVLGLQQHQQQPQNSNHQFQCHFCASVFMRNQDLTRHVASVHEKTRLFTCPGCPGTRFSRKDALKRHVRTFKCCPIDLIR